MLYLYLAKFHFQKFLIYPFEIVAELLKRITWLIFIIFLWTIVAKESKTISVSEVVPYFLIATGVRDIVMARWGVLGSELYRSIKDGKISNYLVKPISIVPAFYAIAFGKHGMRFILSMALIVIGVIFSGSSFYSIIIFLILFFNAILIGFAYNVFEGSLTFVHTETYGLRNAMQHVIQVLSGSMAPLFLFPEKLRLLALATPFPSMIYAPTRVLTKNSFNQEVLSLLLNSLFWALVMNLLVYLFWNWSKKKYEAVGI